MQTLVNSLAVLAFAGVVLLLLANSALLRMVRELQAALVEQRLNAPQAADRSHRRVTAFANDDGRSTFALVVDGQCPACLDRARHFTALAADGPPARMVAISSDEQCARWFDGSQVAIHLDPVLLGQIWVAVTPTLIKYGPDGQEEWRRVVGDDAEMDRLIGAADLRVEV